jgi:hypothetical protein
LVNHNDVAKDNDCAIEPEAEGQQNHTIGLDISLDFDIVA